MTQEKQQEIPSLQKQVVWFYEYLEGLNDRKNLAPLFALMNHMLSPHGRGEELRLRQSYIGEYAKSPAAHQAFIQALENYELEKDYNSGIEREEPVTLRKDLLITFLTDLQRRFEQTHSGQGESVKMEYPLAGYNPLTGKIVLPARAPFPLISAPVPDVNAVSRIGTIGPVNGISGHAA